MRSLTGKTRYAFLAFFASHIPATLIFDSQVAFPGCHPQILQDLLQWYTTTFNDSLMRPPNHETWFRTIVYAEVCFQLTFFFYAVYGLLNPNKVNGKGVGMFRLSCMIYGAHTSTTLIPILACLATNPGANFMEKVAVVSIYLPYLTFPLWLVFICVVSNDIFESSLEGKKKK
jgi:hypothetical protein